METKERQRTTSPDILWPGECRDRHWVGGKAASLGEMATAWPVPPFFCLTATTAAAWRESFEESKLRAAHDALMGESLMDEGPSAMAVRSSAIGEDGGEVSFAGQYVSVLDVIGFPAMRDAIERCLLSAGSARAGAYRESAEVPSMAVIVQSQVRADASAVAFSADPISGDRGSIKINAAWGLGEGIASGALTPDTFAVRRLDGVISAALSEKSHMVVATGGGVARVPVPTALRRYPALTLAQVRHIAAMTEDLEARLGRPVDVECCVQGDHLHLLQCRPITALEQKS